MTTKVESVVEIMQELSGKGTAQTKKTMLRHGACEPLFGVKISDLKPLQKRLKGQQALALELFATKNSDAMYLAGLVANGQLMTKQQLDQWSAEATWHMIAACSVAWVAAEHPQCIPIANQWISSRRELTAIAGWSTLSAAACAVPDEQLPIDELAILLERVAEDLEAAPDRVRYAMNGYVITCGTYVASLGEKAIAVARAIGPVSVDMGDTACQVPDAQAAIIKARRGADVAPKRKTARC